MSNLNAVSLQRILLRVGDITINQFRVDVPSAGNDDYGIYGQNTVTVYIGDTHISGSLVNKFKLAKIYTRFKINTPTIVKAIPTA